MRIIQCLRLAVHRNASDIRAVLRPWEDWILHLCAVDGYRPREKLSLKFDEADHETSLYLGACDLCQTSPHTVRDAKHQS